MYNVSFVGWSGDIFRRWIVNDCSAFGYRRGRVSKKQERTEMGPSAMEK